MRRIALLCLPLLLLLSVPASADNWAVFPPGSVWNGVLAESWPYVSPLQVSQCSGSDCASVALGTGYLVLATWSGPQGPETLSTTVTADHVLCLEGMASANRLDGFGLSLYDGRGLCGESWAYSPPQTDTAAWLWGTTGGLPLAPPTWPVPGSQLLVPGYPDGHPAATLLTVAGAPVPGAELEDNGTRIGLPAIIAANGPVYPGNSGSPALDSAGRVVGTVVAAGGKAGWLPNGQATWQGIDVVIVPWWEGY